MFCDKLGWNWLSSSGVDEFWIFVNIFFYFVSISPWEWAWSFIWITWISFTQVCFMSSSVEIGPAVLEKKMKRLKVNRRTDKRTDGRRTTGDKKSSLELSTQVSLNQEVQRLEDIFGLIHMFRRMSSTSLTTRKRCYRIIRERMINKNLIFAGMNN